ncbi:MAG: hypothetical protein KF823_09725 [Xanthomonadales bacterium]|nr:hypothetical protein [Xanthomonadales bacterium]
MANPFDTPQLARDNITGAFQFSINQWSGRPYVVVIPTRYCPVGCAHCYFASPKPGRSPEAGSILAVTDVQLLTRFLNDANVGLLQLSGGGEPLLELESVCELLAHTRAYRAAITTSAVMAKTDAKATQLLDQLCAAFASSPSEGELIFRLSVDEFHTERIRDTAVQSVIQAFRAGYPRYRDQSMRLKLHSIMGDKSIDKLLDQLADEVADVQSEVVFGEERPTRIVLKDRSEILADYSLRMYADTLPDLNDTAANQRAVAAYEALRIPTPAQYIDEDGNPALCLIVQETGEVELWNTTPPDRQVTLRTHDYIAARKAYSSDIIQVAALQRGARFVEEILSEVNPRAVTRAKVIGSAISFNKNMLVQGKDRLYVTVRLVQEYLVEGRLTSDDLKSLDSISIELVGAPVARLQDMYRSASSDILSETLDRPDLHLKHLVDLFKQVRRGHFAVDEEEMVTRVHRAAIADETKAAFIQSVQVAA